MSVLIVMTLFLYCCNVDLLPVCVFCTYLVYLDQDTCMHGINYLFMIGVKLTSPFFQQLKVLQNIWPCFSRFPLIMVVGVSALGSKGSVASPLLALLHTVLEIKLKSFTNRGKDQMPL